MYTFSHCRVLVATDCAGMGLDVADIDMVINVGKLLKYNNDINIQILRCP